MARAFDIFLADGPRANCAQPANLAIVDAAFDRPGGPAGIHMRDHVCPGCPIGEQCLDWAMRWREDGVWGGIGPNGRTRHGAPAAGSLRAQSRELREGSRADEEPAAGTTAVSVSATESCTGDLQPDPTGRHSAPATRRGRAPDA